MILVGMRGLIVPHDFRQYHAQSTQNIVVLVVAMSKRSEFTAWGWRFLLFGVYKSRPPAGGHKFYVAPLLDFTIDKLMS